MLDTPGLRPPQQERSQRTLERVLDAGLEVFAARGYDGLTIAEVCRAAHTSAGAVYTRFENKDALVRVVHDHAMGEMLAAVDAMYADRPLWQQLDTPSFIEHAVQLLVSHVRERARIVRAIVLRAAGDPVMRSSGAVAIGKMADAFTARVMERADDLPQPNPEASVRAVFGMAFEAISWDVAFGGEFRDAGALWPPPDERLPGVCRLVLLTPPV
ncbi:MAG: TetR/AcrR family transcriptional regulator [Microbacterium sp.]|uniref:TetR/AcrR family transcriptional regulator n=1 Tax=Microbacterium sp. TaxID=51671 RepID=UPI003A8ABA07